METKVTAVAITPEAAPIKPPATPQPPKGAEPIPVAGTDSADTRLVIEADRASGSYVYKTVNRVTGEVVQQLPRAEVLRMKGGADYASGAVIRTKV